MPASKNLHMTGNLAMCESRIFATRENTCRKRIKLPVEPRATLSAAPIGSDPLLG